MYRKHASVLILAALAAGCGGDRGAQAADSAATRDNPSAGAPAAAAPGAPAAAADGRAVYNRTCVTCHQANGQGMPRTFPPLAGSPYANGDKARLVRIVLHGLQGPLEVHGQRFNNVMPPWKTLSDGDIAAVLTYVRSSFGNTSDAVTPEEVARERAATASRATMLTAQELGTP